MTDKIALWRKADILPPDDPSIIQINRGRILPAAPVQQRHELRTPRREPSLEADAWVPGVQAVFTSFAALVLSAVVTWLMRWPWYAALIGAALGLALGWLWRLRVVDRLLWQVETWLDADIDGDGSRGQPVTEHAYTLANPAQARATVATDAAADAASTRQAELLAFVNVCRTHGCSERYHHVLASGPSREAYIAKRDALLQLGIAAWKAQNPRAGWHLVVNQKRAHDIIKRHVL